MAKKTWNQKMTALLHQKKWDMKDWHRAIGVDQWALEQIINMDTSAQNQEALEKIYNDTKEAKLDKNLLRFNTPVIIVVWTHKGGTGKSTTAINLSYELSQRGYNVLAIDIDSQSDMSGVLYPSYLENPELSFYESFILCEDFADEGYIQHTDYLNLDIIPGSAKCEGLEGMLGTMDESIRNRFWGKCLKGIRRENYYDFIIIDMDKTAGVMNTLTLAEADYVLSPLEPMIFAVKSVPPILSQIAAVKKSNPKLELLGLLYNTVDMRKKKALADSMELVEGIAPGVPLKNYIKNDSNIDNSQREHMPLGAYNKSCVVNKQMVAVTDELLDRVKKGKRDM